MNETSEYIYEFDEENPSLESLKFIVYYLSSNLEIQNFLFSGGRNRDLRADVSALKNLSRANSEIAQAPLDTSPGIVKRFLRNVKKFIGIIDKHLPRVANLTLTQMITEGRIAVDWQVQFQQAIRLNSEFDAAMAARNRSETGRIAKETAERLKRHLTN